MTYMRTMRLVVAVVVASSTAVVAVPRLSSQNLFGECGLDFDDSAALAAIPDQAANTFAAKYRMRCSTHWLNVETLNHQHFHLSFEDPVFANQLCFALADGITGYGRMVNGKCVAADWDHEPRQLDSHDQGHWLKIWMEDASSHQPRAFDLRRIHVGVGPSVQLWVRTADGTWWCWSELKGGENWKVEQWSKRVMEVRIRGAKTGPGPYTIRDAYVTE